VRGTHGIRPKDQLDWPVMMGQSIEAKDTSLAATGVRDCLLQALGLEPN